MLPLDISSPDSPRTAAVWTRCAAPLWRTRRRWFEEPGGITHVLLRTRSGEVVRCRRGLWFHRNASAAKRPMSSVAIIRRRVWGQNEGQRQFAVVPGRVHTGRVLDEHGGTQYCHGNVESGDALLDAALALEVRDPARTPRATHQPWTKWTKPAQAVAEATALPPGVSRRRSR